MRIRFFLSVIAICAIQTICEPLYAQYTPVKFTYESIRVNSIYAGGSDTVITNIIKPYKLSIQKEMNVVLATSVSPIFAEKPEGSLNNLVADAVFEIGKLQYKNSATGPIDFCLLNYGGLRKGLPEGDIIVENVYELMPFDNKLCVISLEGEQVVELFDFLASKNEGHPIANCKLVVEKGVVKDVSVAGAPINKDKIYKVVTNDYLSTGNDGMYFFKKAVRVEEIDFLIRDAIVEYIRIIGSKPLNIQKDGRFVIKN